ncbi:hypothetical protein [Streptomyces sp. NPDC001652]|uniref:hypothetical protein n=1 Tax=Streptomyces sp. NPDC001652 TaxID=3154393 RepID=UPI00332EF758
MLNTSELITCPTFDEPGNFHFELRCEDCDAQRLSRLNLGQVDDRYRQGRVTQNGFEAYMYVWALLSPAGSRAEWRETPEDPTVRRIARKLLTLRGTPIPAGLVGAPPVELAAVTNEFPAATQAA